MSRAKQVLRTPQTLAEILPTIAIRHGSKLALRASGESTLEALSYEALDGRSATARDRIGRLVREGDFVMLAGESNVSRVLAFLGTLRLGAIPVPVNPALDDESLRAVLSEVRPAAVIADAGFLSRTGHYQSACAQIDISTIEDSKAGYDQSRDAVPDGDSIAMLLHTTGTTGRPKGVMLSHRNILSNVAGVIDATNLSSEDSVRTPLPLFHAFPLTVGLLAPLVQGVPIDLEAKPTRLASRIELVRPTFIIGAPALYEAVFRQIRRRADRGFRGGYFKLALGLNRLLFRPVHMALGGRLRYAVSGGAPLRPDTQREALAMGVSLLQGYGR